MHMIAGSPRTVTAFPADLRPTIITMGRTDTRPGVGNTGAPRDRAYLHPRNSIGETPRIGPPPPAPRCNAQTRCPPLPDVHANQHQVWLQHDAVVHPGASCNLKYSLDLCQVNPLGSNPRGCASVLRLPKATLGVIEKPRQPECLDPARPHSTSCPRSTVTAAVVETVGLARVKTRAGPGGFAVAVQSFFTASGTSEGAAGGT
jgi:hypothetical protein